MSTAVSATGKNSSSRHTTYTTINDIPLLSARVVAYTTCIHIAVSEVREPDKT